MGMEESSPVKKALFDELHAHAFAGKALDQSPQIVQAPGEPAHAVHHHGAVAGELQQFRELRPAVSLPEALSVKILSRTWPSSWHLPFWARVLTRPYPIRPRRSAARYSRLLRHIFPQPTVSVSLVTSTRGPWCRG